MDNVLSFKKAKSTYMTVEMQDDKKILVKVPTKKIMDVLVEMGEDLKDVREDSASDALNRIYNACADILSNNMKGEKISVDYLAEMFSIEDVIVFFNSYTRFVAALQVSIKN